MSVKDACFSTQCKVEKCSNLSEQLCVWIINRISSIEFHRWFWGLQKNEEKKLHVIDLHTFFNCNSESVSFPMPNERITDFSFWNVLCFTMSYENFEKMNMSLHWQEGYGTWSLHHDLWSSEYRRFYYRSKLANIFPQYEAFLDPIAEFRWISGKSISEVSIRKV